MKITIIQGAFLPVPPLRGGAVEKIWYQLGRQFAEWGHDVTHISRSFTGLKDSEITNGVKYVRVTGYDTPFSLIKLKWLDLRYTIRAIKHIPHDTDVIVTNTFWSPILLRGRKGKRTYADVQRVPRGQMKYYQHIGALRGCSPAICDAIKKEIPSGSHHLVSYIANPVPFQVKPINVTREKIILFVGRIHPEKGIDILIEAFSLLKKDITDEWKLVIVGPSDIKDGGGGDLYKQKLLSLSNNLNITFSGPVYKDEELITYYAKASIFCYPAQEGSGDAAPVAPREAMAYGCVPVVSQLECFKDFIENDKNGICFDHVSDNQSALLANGLTKLITDKFLLQRMAEEGKLIYKKFSIEVIGEEFISDFKNRIK